MILSLFCPHFQKRVHLDRILECQLFSLSTLSVLFRCLLASTLSWEESAINCIDALPQTVINCFSLAAFKNFSVIYCQQYDVPGCRYLWFILLRICWTLWICRWICCIEFGKLAIISSNDCWWVFVALFLGIPFSPLLLVSNLKYTYLRILGWLSLRLCSCFLSSFFKLDHLSIVQTLFSFISHLLLSPFVIVNFINCMC